MNRYKLARFKAGLNLTDAAAQAGVGRTTLSLIESGDTTSPQATIVRKLAETYNVDVEYLLGLEDEPQAAA